MTDHEPEIEKIMGGRSTCIVIPGSIWVSIYNRQGLFCIQRRMDEGGGGGAFYVTGRKKSTKKKTRFDIKKKTC